MKRGLGLVLAGLSVFLLLATTGGLAVAGQTTVAVTIRITNYGGTAGT